MQKIGIALTTIGWLAMFCLVSTDDFYVMELRQAHDMNWDAFFGAAALAILGVLIYMVGDGLQENGDEDEYS